jgi:hypothetical protein
MSGRLVIAIKAEVSQWFMFTPLVAVGGDKKKPRGVRGFFYMRVDRVFKPNPILEHSQPARQGQASGGVAEK